MVFNCSVQLQDNNVVRIIGLRFEDESSESNDGIPGILCDKEQTIRIFGVGLKKNTVIAFTNEQNEYRGACQKPTTDNFKPSFVSEDESTATYTITIPYSENVLYICAKIDEGVSVSAIFILQL